MSTHTTLTDEDEDEYLSAVVGLRDYQQQAHDAVLQHWQEHDNLLAVLPTGMGKTSLAAHVIKSRVQFDFQRARFPKPALFLAHRDELVGQAMRAFPQFVGLVPGLEKAESRAMGAGQNHRVIVASVQSMARRLEWYPPDYFGTVVLDEAHHATSVEFLRVLNHFSSAKHLGITATAWRTDKKALSGFYQDIAFELSIKDGIDLGFLCPITVQTVPLQIDLNGIRQTGGDYDAEELDERIEPYLGEVIQAINQYAHDRRTLVFLPLIRTSKVFAELARSAGIRAMHIDGDSKDRKYILHSFKTGEIQLVSNAMLLTEGYDNPAIDCIVFLRPTRSRLLAMQAWGRGTRIAPNKRNLLLLDFLWMYEKHPLISPASLAAGSDREAEELSSRLRGGTRRNLFDELDAVRVDEQTKREKSLQEQIDKNRNRRAKVIDPVEFAVMLRDYNLEEYEPTWKWEHDAPSDKQLALLRKAGIDGDQITSKGQASKIIDLIFMRQSQGLATPKQLFWLRRTGFDDVPAERATFEQAKAWLDQRFRTRTRR